MFDGLTYACASRAELWSARRRKSVLVGIACHNERSPEGDLASWGVSGALASDLRMYEPVEGVRVVDLNRNELWRRDQAAPPTGLREVTVFAARDIVNDPDERAWLHDRTGAHVLDMESGVLAHTGRLKRIVRVVSDGPNDLLRVAASLLKRDGRVDTHALTCALTMDPLGTLAELARLSKAIYSLSRLSLR